MLIISSCLAVLMLNGCSGNGSSSSQNGSTGRNNDPNGMLPFKDLESFNYGSPSNQLSTQDANTPTCSSDNAVCVSGTNPVLGAKYALGNGGVKFWVIPQVSFHYTISFNKVVSNFRLSDIVGDIDSSSQNPNGTLTQIDTSECDNRNANSTGKCNISFIYTGFGNPQNGSPLNIAFTFKWDGGNLVYNQPTQNSLYSDQAIPILNDLSGGVIFQTYNMVENENGTDLEYSKEMNFTQSYINNGSASIIGSPATPTLALSLALNNRFNASPMQIAYTNGYYTDCEDGTVSVGGRCGVALTYLEDYDQSTNTVYPQSSFLTAEYNNSLSSSVIPYVRQLVMTTGDFPQIPDTKAVYDESVESDPFLSVVKPSFGNGFLSYMPQESNVTFFISYEPTRYIGSSVINGKLVYGVGDYTVDATPSGSLNEPTNVYSGTTVANEIPIKFDPTCFNSFTSDDSNPSCNITFPRTNLAMSKLGSKPLAVGIYARYFSPVEDKNIVQLLGNITFSRQANVSVAPYGIYMYAPVMSLANAVASYPSATFNVSFNGNSAANIMSGYISPDFYARAYNLGSTLSSNYSQGIPLLNEIIAAFDQIWIGYSHTDASDQPIFGSISGCTINTNPANTLSCPVAFQTSINDGLTHSITCPIMLYYSSRTSTDKVYDDGRFAVEWETCQSSENGAGFSLDSLGNQNTYNVHGLYINMLSK